MYNIYDLKIRELIQRAERAFHCKICARILEIQSKYNNRFLRARFSFLTNMSHILRLFRQRLYYSTVKQKINQSTLHLLVTPHRQFKTSPQLNAITPYALIAVQPLLKVIILPLLGRNAKVWWQRLPAQKKQDIQAKVKRNLPRLFFGLAGYYAMLLAVYSASFETVPITNRRRFRIISQEQYKNVSNIQFDIIKRRFDKLLLEQSHPDCERVIRIAEHILTSNKSAFPEISNNEWTISVIDSKMKNAVVLASGHIIVFRGMIDACRSDDELGAVICHEMSHVLLKHGSDLMSRNIFKDCLMLPLIAPIWFFSPTIIGAALIYVWLNMLSSLVTTLPYNRKLELEADLVGLQMAARSCYDVRAVPAFWRYFDAKQKNELGYAPLGEPSNYSEYFSTHPSNEHRQKRLESLMNEAIELRQECNCVALPDIDPQVTTEFDVLRLQESYNERVKNRVIPLKTQ